jgi:hypothetical protein
MPTIVPAIAPEQIESVEAGLPTPEEQVFELRFAMAVEAHDSAIENRRPGTQFGR